MRQAVSYDDCVVMPGSNGRPVTQEVAVHPYLVSQLASEHVRDMRKQAAAARRATLARRARRGPSAPAADNHLMQARLQVRTGTASAPAC